MPVFCSHCNEKLFGAVNRCWKCGRHFSARPAAGDTPPVRRAPVAGPVMLVREESGVVIIEDVGRPVMSGVQPAVEVTIITDEAPIVDAELVGEEKPLVALAATSAEFPPAMPEPAEPLPAGSPFAAGWTNSGPPTSLAAVHETPVLSGDLWSSAAASTSLALGVVGLVAALFHWWPVATGFVGLAAGIWGLRSQQAPLATAGLGVCSASIAVSEFQAAAAIYQYFTGMHPFTV